MYPYRQCHENQGYEENIPRHVDLFEEDAAPLHEMQGIHVKDVLLAFVHLSLHPVPVEISEKVVDIFSSVGKALPLLDVVCE